MQLSDGFGFSFPSRSVTARYVRDTLPGTKNNGCLKPGTFFLSFFLSLSFCDAMLRPDGGRRSVRARDYRSSHTAFDKCSGQLGDGGGGGSLSALQFEDASHADVLCVCVCVCVCVLPEATVTVSSFEDCVQECSDSNLLSSPVAQGV